MMRTVYLHGILGERYGREHHFALSCPREAVSALSANFQGFRADFNEHPYYGIVCDDENRHPGNCPSVGEYPFSRDMHLVPMIEGRLGALLTPLLVPIVGVTAAGYISGALTIGLLFGISLLLAPKPPKEEEETRDANYIFSGPDNVVSQGAAVPLIYGRCFVGSVVISSGLDVAQGAGTNHGEGHNYKWRTPAGLERGGDALAAPPAQARALAIEAAPDEPEKVPAGRGPVWVPVNG